MTHEGMGNKGGQSTVTEMSSSSLGKRTEKVVKNEHLPIQLLPFWGSIAA